LLSPRRVKKHDRSRKILPEKMADLSNKKERDSATLRAWRKM
jgi:hypothetical protein